MALLELLRYLSNIYSNVPNKRACTFISGKVCLLALIEPRLFGTLEYFLPYIFTLIFLTLESGINVAPGKFSKKNKHSHYLNRLYGVRNKGVAPGKKSKK